MNEYLLDLGNGMFLNAAGEIVQPPPGWTGQQQPVFTAPGGYFPIDPSAWVDATKAVRDGLKSLSDPNDGGKTLQKLGVPADVMELLGKAADIASTIATFTGIAGVAIKLLAALEIFKFGKSPLEMLIEKRFDELQQQVRALEEQATHHDLRNILVPFGVATAMAHEYNDQVAHYSGGNLEPAYTALRNKRDELSANLALAFHSATWEAIYYPDDYKDWDLVHLVGFSGIYSAADDGSERRCNFPAPLTLRFDHRLLLPVAIQTVQSYLMVCQTLVPEFRSTGNYYDEIKDAARALMQLTRRMRTSSLGRTTDFTAQNFSQLTDNVSQDDAGNLYLDDWWYVGAVDLCAYTAAVLGQQRFDAMQASPWAWLEPTSYGTIEHWHPPAKLAEVKSAEGLFTRYRITNPDECAAAARRTSENLYARLLAFSGYTHLLQLTGLLRLHAAQPDLSETVTGRLFTGRQVTAKSPTVARSPEILFTGVIEADAVRIDQRFRASLEIETQPLGRERPVKYRVLLRTLRSPTSDGQIDELPYRQYHSTSYEPDPAEPDFLQLTTDTDDQVLIDNVELIGGWTATPTRDIEGSGVAEFNANTFEWYVPAAPLRPSGPSFGRPHRSVFGRIDQPSSSVHLGAGSSDGSDGSSSDGPNLAEAPFARLVDAGRGAGLDWLNWDSEPNLDQGQQRNPEHRAVKLAWKLSWRGKHLVIDLNSEPLERNYVVYVVVEEALEVPTHNVLHTALRVSVDTALTLVPTSFFSDEAAAYERASEILRDIAIRYVEEAEVKPGEQEEGVIRPGELRTMDHMRDALERLNRLNPEVVDEVIGRFEAPVR